jgi:hypothetical protein
LPERHKKKTLKMKSRMATLWCRNLILYLKYKAVTIYVKVCVKTWGVQNVFIRMA